MKVTPLEAEHIEAVVALDAEWVAAKSAPWRESAFDASAVFAAR
eukprot:SAG11_NODE_3578_length_2358_cov_3.440018_5_plen_44_part_00